MSDVVAIILIAVVVVAALVMTLQLAAARRAQRDAEMRQAQSAEDKHRAMLTDLHDGLARHSERVGAALAESNERLRESVARELGDTRQTLQTLQLALQQSLAQNREQLQKILAEESRAEQALIQGTLQRASAQIGTSVEQLAKTVGERLDQISGRVAERLDEGFKKTNETFVNVMARLATIDEAQKKIDGLTTNVVSLQELLGDKRSRGAFGEVQLEALVRNVLPPQAFEMQATLPNGTRADCVLKLPPPTGLIAVDSKFPLENFNRMFDSEVPAAERGAAQRQFKADVRKHVDDIAARYIIAGTTADGAVMFLPAEAVFAEIHAYHRDLVDYAMSRRVWIVSPTTLMAVLNTARAVIKDMETRQQVDVIKQALIALGKDFKRFDQRMTALAQHIRQAHDDAQKVQISSRKLTTRFERIENADISQALEENGGRIEDHGSG